MRPRSRADILPHGPLRAARAACTAASTPSFVAEATVAQTSSVAGLTTSIVLPPEASRHSLLIRSFFCSTAVVVTFDLTARLETRPPTGPCNPCDPWLFSGELGFALLQAGGDPFFRVVALEQQLLQLALD